MASERPHVETAVRGARTQSLFRDVNERVLEINEVFSLAVPLGDWVCECASQACSERIEVMLPEYDEVRANPMRFLVAPSDDHVLPEIEKVVAKAEGYWVVEKEGMAAKLATKVDPRRVGVRGDSPRLFTSKSG